VTLELHTSPVTASAVMQFCLVHSNNAPEAKLTPDSSSSKHSASDKKASLTSDRNLAGAWQLLLSTPPSSKDGNHGVPEAGTTSAMPTATNADTVHKCTSWSPCMTHHHAHASKPPEKVLSHAAAGWQAAHTITHTSCRAWCTEVGVRRQQDDAPTPPTQSAESRPF